MLLDERRDAARRYVETGRRIIQSQQTLIAMLKEQNRSSTFAEGLLEKFEQSQAIFEEDLARLTGAH